MVVPLSELGLGDQKIQVEHTIILATTAALEKPIKKILAACGSSSERTMKTVEVIGFGIAAYLVLAGSCNRQVLRMFKRNCIIVICGVLIFVLSSRFKKRSSL